MKELRTAMIVVDDRTAGGGRHPLKSTPPTPPSIGKDISTHERKTQNDQFNAKFTRMGHPKLNGPCVDIIHPSTPRGD